MYLLIHSNHADARAAKEKQASLLSQESYSPQGSDKQNEIPFTASPSNTGYNIFECFSVLPKDYLLWNPLWLLKMQTPGSIPYLLDHNPWEQGPGNH